MNRNILNLKTILKQGTCLALFFLITGCDFSARINKEIISAQEAYNNQNYLKAAAIYEQILERNPPELAMIKIHYQLGDLYGLHLKMWDKAILNFKSIVDLESKEVLWKIKAVEKLGEIYFSYSKDFKKSASMYKKLAEFKPSLPSIDLYELRYGVSLLNSKEYKLSEKIFAQIREDSGHTYFIRSKYFLGLINFELKNWHQAISEWKTYIIEEKRSDYVVQTKFLLANTYETTEDLKKAYNIYYNILNHYPNPQVIKSRLEALYSRRVARKR